MYQQTNSGNYIYTQVIPSAYTYPHRMTAKEVVDEFNRQIENAGYKLNRGSCKFVGYTEE